MYKKLDKLKKLILGYKSCLIAFSGGVDSSFLLKIAACVLPKDRLLAVTAVSPTYPREELILAKKTAKKIGASHKVIRTYETKDKNFIGNPPERCYYCKKELFLCLKSLARQEKLAVVLDASNVDDRADFRPGSRAKKELKILSPLDQAGLSKDEIRHLSREIGLPTWDKPSLACLASRIPYGQKISLSGLKRIEQAEAFLKVLGFLQARVRDYQEYCRIEVPLDKIDSLVKARSRIVDKFKKLGYNYVTVDLQGYRTGSMNEVIK